MCWLVRHNNTLLPGMNCKKVKSTNNKMLFVSIVKYKNVFCQYLHSILIKAILTFFLCTFQEHAFQETRTPLRSPKRHQPKTKPINSRRGESGGERKGGPLWSPASCSSGFHLENTTTPHPAGDHKGPPNPTSSSLAPTDRPAPYLICRLRLMPLVGIRRRSTCLSPRLSGRPGLRRGGRRGRGRGSS